jgi:hypothetical protein
MGSLAMGWDVASASWLEGGEVSLLVENAQEVTWVKTCYTNDQF